MSRGLTFVLSLLLLVTITGSARASEARAQSLLYNLAFEDQTDVFTFPNLLPQYQGLYFYLPRAVQNVYGGVIYNFSDNSAIGAFVHRPLMSAFDQYRLSATDVATYLGYSPFDSNNALQPHLSGQVVDLMYGARSWGLALRVHGWSNASNQDPPLNDPGEAAAALTVEINSGFRLGSGFNLRAGVGLRNVWDNYFLLMPRVGLRYIDPAQRKVRLVVAADLQGGLFFPDDDALDNSYALTVPAKIGMRIAAIENVLSIGLLAGLDMQLIKLGDESTRFGLAIPVLELGAEWTALEWLKVRTAIKGGYGFQIAGPGDTNPKHEQMTFSSGLGFPLGPFCIDAVIQYSLWQDGPWFVGGNPGLFAGVSLAYTWGRGDERETAPGPAAAPEASQAPAPAAPAPVPAKKEAAPEKKPAPKTAGEEKPASDAKPKGEPEFEGWEG